MVGLNNGFDFQNISSQFNTCFFSFLYFFKAQVSFWVANWATQNWKHLILRRNLKLFTFSSIFLDSLALSFHSSHTEWLFSQRHHSRLVKANKYWFIGFLWGCQEGHRRTTCHLSFFEYAFTRNNLKPILKQQGCNPQFPQNQLLPLLIDTNQDLCIIVKRKKPDVCGMLCVLNGACKGALSVVGDGCYQWRKGELNLCWLVRKEAMVYKIMYLEGQSIN